MSMGWYEFVSQIQLVGPSHADAGDLHVRFDERMWKRSSVEPLRHRQTKGAETDMFDLQKPRHISTLPCVTSVTGPHGCASLPNFWYGMLLVFRVNSLPGSQFTFGNLACLPPEAAIRIIRRASSERLLSPALCQLGVRSARLTTSYQRRVRRLPDRFRNLC